MSLRTAKAQHQDDQPPTFTSLLTTEVCNITASFRQFSKSSTLALTVDEASVLDKVSSYTKFPTLLRTVNPPGYLPMQPTQALLSLVYRRDVPEPAFDDR